MLQAMIRLSWITAVLGSLWSPVQMKSEQPQPWRLQAECSPGGSLRVRMDEQETLVEAHRPAELETGPDGTAKLTALADEGYEIEQISLDGHSEKEAQGKTEHTSVLVLKQDSKLSVRFRAVQNRRPVLPLAEKLSMSADSWQQMLEDYQKGETDAWKTERLKAAELLGVDHWVDEEGFVTERFHQTFNVRAFLEKGGAICSRRWIQAESAGRISAPVRAKAAGQNDRNQGLSVASVQYYSSIQMPGGNFMSNEYWTLSNGQKAFCADYIKAGPRPGQRVEAPREADSPALRKALYYGYGGPDNRLASRGFITQAQQIVVTNDLVSMANTGTCISREEAGGVNWRASVSALWSYVQSLPDPADFRAYLCSTPGSGSNHNGMQTGYQPLAYGIHQPRGALRLHKASAVPGVSAAGSVNYSLEGARFSVRTSQERNGGREAAALRIGADGFSSSVELVPGTYWIHEIDAPAGYLALQAPQQVTIEAGSTVQAPQTVLISEQPQYAKPWLILQKVNSISGQADAGLKGALFRMNYYNLPPDQPDVPASAVPVRSWLMQTDDRGQIHLGDSYRVEGDDFFRNERNEPVFPLGIVTFQEETPPPGYQKNPERFLVRVRPGLQGAQISAFDVPEVAEDPLGLVIIKQDSESRQPLANAVFQVLDPALRRRRYTSDEQGRIELAFERTGRYLLSEIQAPAGYIRSERSVVITVSEEGITCDVPQQGDEVIFSNGTLHYGNTPKKARLRIRKTDESGQPLEGAKFALFLDREQTRQVETGSSGPDGEVFFEGIPEGEYWLSEIEAPAGYSLMEDENGRPVSFHVQLEWAAPDGPAQFTVDGHTVSSAEGMFRVLEEAGSSILEISWTNRRRYGPVLPQTGTLDPLFYPIGGAAAAAAGLCSRHGAAKRPKPARRKRMRKRSWKAADRE